MNPLQRCILKLFPDLTDKQRNEVIFANVPPTLTMGFRSDQISYFILHADSAEVTTAETGVLYAPGAMDEPLFEERRQINVQASIKIGAQDRHVDTLVQRGLRSRFAIRGRYSWQEQTHREFNKWLVDRYRATWRDRDGEQLRDRRRMTALHHLPARAGNVHWGYFDAALAPALRVTSGDLIRAEAITHHAGDAPDLMMDAAIRELYAAIPEHDRAPGVHIMTGPIYVEGAMPGDMLEVRYLEMMPRLDYGSNLAAHWGHLYREMAERERVTIYRLHREANQATAMFAYDVAEKYLVPGRITDCSACDCQPALAGHAHSRRGRISAPPASRPTWRDVSAASRPASMAATSTTGGSARARRCIIRCRCRARCSRSAIRMSRKATARSAAPRSRPRSTCCSKCAFARTSSFRRRCWKRRCYWIVHGFDEDLNVAMRNASLDMMHSADRAPAAEPRRRLFADERRGRFRGHAGGGRPTGNSLPYSSRDVPLRPCNDVTAGTRACIFVTANTWMGIDGMNWMAALLFGVAVGERCHSRPRRRSQTL